MRAGKRTPVNVPAEGSRWDDAQGRERFACGAPARPWTRLHRSLADGWIEATALDGSAYYINTSTQETRWQRPDPAPPPPPPGVPLLGETRSAELIGEPCLLYGPSLRPSLRTRIPQG